MCLRLTPNVRVESHKSECITVSSAITCEMRVGERVGPPRIGTSILALMEVHGANTRHDKGPYDSLADFSYGQLSCFLSRVWMAVIRCLSQNYHRRLSNMITDLEE